jgi:hypothetical protein
MARFSHDDFRRAMQPGLDRLADRIDRTFERRGIPKRVVKKDPNKMAGAAAGRKHGKKWNRRTP